MSNEPLSGNQALPAISRRTFEGLDAEHRSGDADLGTAQIGRDTVDGGRVFVAVRVVDSWPLFHPGQTVMTTNAERHLEAAGLDPVAVYSELMDRHLGGDWGRTYVEDLYLNDEALRDGDRIFSVYEVAGETYWMISDAPEQPGAASPCSTLLMPDDY